MVATASEEMAWAGRANAAAEAASNEATTCMGSIYEITLHKGCCNDVGSGNMPADSKEEASL